MIRIFWQKYRMKHQFQWHQYRVMPIQVVLISFLFLIFPFSDMVITFLQLFGFSDDIATTFLTLAMFSTYYALLLFPTVTVALLPELRGKLKITLQLLRKRRTVAPQIIEERIVC
ncbi:unnamed protein product [Rotaria magnacalcarata]|uniref:Uncharacterized protein n=1 Tax=Rotaria magnacalcarata TaxID=392030 RepID=A0A816MBH0_9BILA|nr:unnamed protein product [Rotaria magnacalcarata]CAF2059108.1 unnamed protein product [Rotaria magnacalcarata]CAF3967991.1 unnamed protein product [Rotaria magnacalcarata]CAF4099668.1 unnamed protein product [Rotaria magnacalcarata]